MDERVSDLLGADHESLAELLRELQLELSRHELARSFKLLDLFWARLAMHIRAENLWLFPKLLNAPPSLFNAAGGAPSFETARVTIEGLRADHNFFMDVLSSAIKTMRGIDFETTPEVADVLEVIRMRIVELAIRLESHNELEEEHVYKWPGLMFGSSDLEELATDMKHELENLPPRFAGKEK